MNFNEGENRRTEEKQPTYRMVCFDMDGVFVDTNKYRESSDKLGVGAWNAVFDSLGLLNEHQRLKNKFKAGGFSSYMEWTHEACEVLKKNGLNEKKFLEIIDHQCFTLGAKETVLELKKQGYRTAVITGSFSALAQRVQNELGIDEAVAHCSLEFDKKG
jgi:phosphoserine phosphatase